MKKRDIKQAFLKQLGDASSLVALFDTLPDVAFFALDLKGRIVMANRRSCEIYHVDKEQDVLGRTDYDLFPKELAERYVKGNRQVLKQGRPIINAIELSPDESNRMTLYSKVPLYGKNGQLVGLACVYRFISQLGNKPAWYGKFSQAINHIHNRYASKLSLRLLSRIAATSETHLERRFRKLLGMSVHEYISHVRVNAARALLETTDKTITEIAAETGFSDHSHLIRTFKQLRRTTPRQYRNSLLRCTVVREQPNNNRGPARTPALHDFFLC